MPLPASLTSARPEVTFPVLNMPRLELCFSDGSMLWLRQASRDPLRRSFDHQGEVHEVDLGQLVPLLHEDVYQAADGDRPAVIFFTLRHRFTSAQAFVDAVLQLHAREQQAIA